MKKGYRNSNTCATLEDENENDIDISETINIIVPEDQDTSRLDSFIGKNLEEVSRNYAVKLIENGNVSVNNKIQVSKKHKLNTGDTLEIQLTKPDNINIMPENIPIEILHEDDDLIVLNKPCGMVVHPGVGNYTGTLVNALMYHCGENLSTVNGSTRPGIVHRIDKNTSGLLVVAKNNSTHDDLAKQLKNHSMTREYIALVYDNIKEEELTISKPIGRDINNRLRRAVNGSGAKDAITHIYVLERYGKYTLVKACLETGRTHQIRVHMSYMHHPLVGDNLYGPELSGEKFMGCYVSGQLLCARTLGFIHPTTKKYIEFHTDPPKEFEKILNKLRKI